MKANTARSLAPAPLPRPPSSRPPPAHARFSWSLWSVNTDQANVRSSGLPSPGPRTHSHRAVIITVPSSSLSLSLSTPPLLLLHVSVCPARKTFNIAKLDTRVPAYGCMFPSACPSVSESVCRYRVSVCDAVRERAVAVPSAVTSPWRKTQRFLFQDLLGFRGLNKKERKERQEEYAMSS